MLTLSHSRSPIQTFMLINHTYFLQRRLLQGLRQAVLPRLLRVRHVQQVPQERRLLQHRRQVLLRGVRQGRQGRADHRYPAAVQGIHSSCYIFRVRKWK